VEISVRGASATETAGNDPETEANTLTEVPVADAAIAPEVLMRKSGFVFEWVAFCLEFK
jgi:hypothetical protein